MGPRRPPPPQSLCYCPAQPERSFAVSSVPERPRFNVSVTVGARVSGHGSLFLPVITFVELRPNMPGLQPSPPARPCASGLTLLSTCRRRPLETLDGLPSFPTPASVCPSPALQLPPLLPAPRGRGPAEAPPVSVLPPTPRLAHAHAVPEPRAPRAPSALVAAPPVLRVAPGGPARPKARCPGLEKAETDTQARPPPAAATHLGVSAVVVKASEPLQAARLPCRRGAQLPPRAPSEGAAAGADQTVPLVLFWPENKTKGGRGKQGPDAAPCPLVSLELRVRGSGSGRAVRSPWHTRRGARLHGAGLTASSLPAAFRQGRINPPAPPAPPVCVWGGIFSPVPGH